MDPQPRCSVCESDDWEVIGHRTYDRSSLESADEYVRKRMRVLFEIWHPGREQVVNESLLCRRCGFVTYTPRPTAEDIERKYRHLVSLGPDSEQDGFVDSLNRLRGERFTRKLARHLNLDGTRVLDFGGGDGRLMIPLLEQGAVCSVVDYSSHCIPEVERLGETLDDVPADRVFDAIISSLVLEHLPDPLGTTRRLAALLRGGGILHVEVPMEIWKRAPLHVEPVTHCNFFCVGSLWRLLVTAGLIPVQVRLEGYEYTVGNHVVVVSAIARKPTQADAVVPQFGPDGVAEVRRLLAPNWNVRLQRVVLFPRLIPKLAWSHVRRVWAR